MNSKRRAELQRKLSMGAVPRPPADLAQRIKAEIPKYLDAHQAPQRFAWSNTFRVAASVMLLLTTALVTRELLEPRRAERASSVARREPVTPAVLRDVHNTTAAETAELSVDITQELPLPAPTAPVATAAAATREESAGATLDSAAEPAMARSRANVAATESLDEPMLMAQAAPPPPPPPAAAVPPPSAPAADAPAPVAEVQVAEMAAAERMTVAAASAPAPQQKAAQDAVAANVFGISVDPRAFREVRSAIETGGRPSPAAVNVEALVNYFAGAKSPRRDVALEVEASPAPIAADGDRAILRFSVDTSTVAAMRGAAPPVGRDARLHIEIDPRAVAAFRRIGDGDVSESEDALLHNTSVTGLYELELKPNLRSS
ncbi:MAG TPA: von Willebrand factor type A domain-containing protein, partial [Thermoanaerobaculia bacterium]|nr:von Willebrand factor type A domain-containing protein [Thermoanaerobaculia bacterium]